MKIRILAPLLCFVLSVFLSCNDDKNEPDTGIAGSWKLQSKEYLDCPDAADNEVIECATGVYGFCNTFTFNADGTFQYKRNHDGSNLGDGTYYFVNGQLTVTFVNDPGGFGGIFAKPTTISGNTMVTTDIGDAATCTTKMTYQRA